MLNTDERQEVKFFTGYEVEHTVCHGMKTLFVVGVQPIDEIAFLATTHDCTHVYFGTSQSFKPNTPDEWESWDNMIKLTLQSNFWVSLDFGVEYAEMFHDYGWCAYQKFVPMISVKLPNIQQFNYNATLKLDDITWGKTNPGVWTHHLTSLMGKDKYTHWDQYTQDTELK